MIKTIPLFVLLFFIFSVHSYDIYERMTSNIEINGSFDSEDTPMFYFDLTPGIVFKKMSMIINITKSQDYNGELSILIRRYVGFSPSPELDEGDSLADYWVTECQKSMSQSSSINPYDCVYETVGMGDFGKEANITVDIPREGRYYMLFVSDDQTGGSFNYTAILDLSYCNGNEAGNNCQFAVSNSHDLHNITGVVQPNEWIYYLKDLGVTAPSMSLTINEGTIQSSDQNAGIYFRYGNIPDLFNFDARVALPTPGDVRNYLNPPDSNFYIGIWGGKSGQGLTYDLTTETSNCPVEDQTNGAYCEADLDEYLFCETDKSKNCAFDFSYYDKFGTLETIHVKKNTWAVTKFILSTNVYRVNMKAQYKDPDKHDFDGIMVVNVESMPTNNENQSSHKSFSLSDVYPLMKEWKSKDDKETEINYLYPTAFAGIYYVAYFNKGDNDFDIEYSYTLEKCPNECSGNGTCDTTTSSCVCTVPGVNPIDCSSNMNPITNSTSTDDSTLQTSIHDSISEPGNSSNDGKSSSSNNLSTTGIVAISICIPLTLFIVIGIIAFGFWYRKRAQYTAI
eukprot:TRINITY_DN9340_c0_g1_i1.p1 TRINITY_DN9340_c0_g1~~TRINITY_DN9340_c0_g1_i1.p1  ORF type:complete len:565 (+),score=163.04 TRINITY_DN9340_c0_g1_i1:47-1741(+)